MPGTGGPSPSGHPGLATRYRDILLDQARRSLAEARSTARERQAALEISDELRTIGTLADESRQAELLVLGDRGMNRVEGLLLGSVGVALAAHAACPVVVLKSRNPVRTSFLILSARSPSRITTPTWVSCTAAFVSAEVTTAG
jgi:hypothetical protein